MSKPSTLAYWQQMAARNVARKLVAEAESARERIDLDDDHTDDEAPQPGEANARLVNAVFIAPMLKPLTLLDTTADRVARMEKIIRAQIEAEAADVDVGEVAADIRRAFDEFGAKLDAIIARTVQS